MTAILKFFLSLYGKVGTFIHKNNAWPCVGSFSDYKYIKKTKQNLILRKLCAVVNYFPVIPPPPPPPLSYHLCMGICKKFTP